MSEFITTTVGRYAPTPSGSLHLGNLRTALAAYLSVLNREGVFLLRIDDLDGQRCKEEYGEQQLLDLQCLGLDWQQDVIVQSQRDEVYTEGFEKLKDLRLIYPCFCSRRDIREALSAPHDYAVKAYPGTCRKLSHQEAMARIDDGEQHSWRLKVENCPTVFFDGFRGEIEIDLSKAGGDFVIRRADGYFSYQLATAIDDGKSGVTEVVRADDLTESGARQAYLMQCLGLPVPRYMHIPLMYGPNEIRLAKRIGSEDLSGFVNRGYQVEQIVRYLVYTLGHEMRKGQSLVEAASSWDWKNVPREPVFFDEETLKRFD